MANKNNNNKKNHTPTPREADIIRVVKEYKGLYEKHMWRRWAKGYRDYLLDGSARGRRVRDFQSNIKVPVVKQYVDALWTSIYDNQLNFKTSGRNTKSHAKANSAHDFLSWAFTRSKSWGRLMDSVKECLIEGNGYMKIGFVDNSEKIEYTKRIKDPGSGEIKTKNIVVEYEDKYPTLNYVSIFNLFYPILSTELVNSPVVVERNILHRDTVLKRYNAFDIDKVAFNEATAKDNRDFIFSYDFDKIKLSAFWDKANMFKDLESSLKSGKSGVKGSNIMALSDDSFFDLLASNYLHVDYDGGFCEVIEYWEGEKLTIMVNSRIIYDSVNPLPDKTHPYVELSFNKIPGISAGRGIALSLADIQDVADEMMNLAIDNQKFLVVPMFEKIKGGDVFSSTDGTIEWKPFKVIETNQKGALQRLDIGNPGLAGLDGGTNFLFQLSEMSEGINSYAIGYQNKVERSATGVSALVQSFKSRLLPLVDSLNQALTIIAKKWLLYGICYYDDQFDIDLFTDGKPIIKTLKIEDLTGEFSIEFNAQSLKTATRELKRESLLNLLNAILPFSQMLKENNATKFRADEFLKDIFDTYELGTQKYFTSGTAEFIKDEVRTEQAKIKITKKMQEGVLTDEQISPKTPSEIFEGNAQREQIANQKAEEKEGTEDLDATPGIDETIVSPLGGLFQ